MANKFWWALRELIVFSTNKRAVWNCTYVVCVALASAPCHSSFCRKPTSAYLAKSSNGHHTAGVAASLLLSITTNGTGFGGVQYILASASGYNISSFAVFLSARTSGRHCLLSVVVLLVIYSRRWRSLGAGLDPRLVCVSFFVSSFLCNNPFIRMRNHLLILLKTDNFFDKKLLIYTVYYVLKAKSHWLTDHEISGPTKRIETKIGT